MSLGEEAEAVSARAVEFLEASDEPHALVWLGLMHGRFGISAFADALRRFDERVERYPDQAHLLRLFRRIADPGNVPRIEDIERVTHPSDGMIVAALYCDRFDLPAHFVEILRHAVRNGGYYCTHALLAGIWILEYGEPQLLPSEFLDELYAANAMIVNADTRSVTDLKLEAAAFLYLAGEGDRIDGRFVRTVIRTQNPDGGWGRARARPDSSDWHGTVLALLLLELYRRSES